MTSFTFNLETKEGDLFNNISLSKLNKYRADLEELLSSIRKLETGLNNLNIQIIENKEAYCELPNKLRISRRLW